MVKSNAFQQGALIDPLLYIDLLFFYFLIMFEGKIKTVNIRFCFISFVVHKNGFQVSLHIKIVFIFLFKSIFNPHLHNAGGSHLLCVVKYMGLRELVNDFLGQRMLNYSGLRPKRQVEIYIMWGSYWLLKRRYSHSNSHPIRISQFKI